MFVKDCVVSIKAGPNDGLAEGEFTAYASVFGTVDSYGDVVIKGAFAKDLERWKASGNPIPLLFGHVMTDPDFNLGHIADAVEDDHGLLVHGVLDLESPKAVQVYRMLKGRRINQMSYAYDVVEDAQREMEDGSKVTELHEVKLYEVSVVTIGANQDTEILAVKASVEALRTKAGRALSAKNEAALREIGDQIKAAATAIADVLTAVEQDSGKSDNAQGKASGTWEAKFGASDDEDTPKSPAPDDEPNINPPVARLAAQTTIYALTEA